MKISPVVGTPTIPNPSATGLSPEKLAAIKAMAGNQPKEEKETIKLGELPNSNTQRIKMNVNRSTTMPIETPPVVEENAPPLEEVKEPEAVGVPDNGVQAKPSPEAIGTVSPELAQLAKEKRAFQLEKAEWEKTKAPQIPEGYIKAEDLKTNALKVLQEQGVTYEQLTNEILGQQSQQPAIDLKSIREDLLKAVDEKLAGKDSQQEDAVYGFMKKEVDKLCFSSEKYKFIRENKAQDKVMDLVKREWRENENILDEVEAMDLIEAELREDARRYVKMMGELEPTEAPEEQPPVQDTVQKPKTLTNKDSARPVMSRRQRAIAAALGQK